ncbi:MAG: molybdopterin converting factor subunit 1 [bacterium]
MKIQLRYFAVLREKTGVGAESITLPDDANVHDAFDAVCALHPDVAPLRNLLRCAVNQAFSDFDHILQDGDEVVFVPPVSGGSGAIQLTTDPLSFDAVRRYVCAPQNGAVLVFDGQVRDHRDGSSVLTLEYETYEEMALRKINEIAERARVAHGCDVAIHHRHGLLHVGESAVLIAVGSPHRAEAFAACREIIEALKVEVPIWKKETGPDGSVWVGVGA